jgi:hypothetical protein
MILLTALYLLPVLQIEVEFETIWEKLPEEDRDTAVCECQRLRSQRMIYLPRSDKMHPSGSRTRKGRFQGQFRSRNSQAKL